MPRRGFIDGADDMQADMERADAAAGGRLTERKRATIRRMSAQHGFSAEWIAKQLGVDVQAVKAELGET